MPWIESHDSIWEHWKTIKLCSILGIQKPQAVGHLHALWHFVLRNAWRDANLERWGDDGIESACFWVGEKGALVKALRESKFIDGHVVYGWSERAGRLVSDRKYNELRKINAVKRRKSEATLPYLTIPNSTLPNQKSTHVRDKAFQKPTVADISGYVTEMGYRVDAERFHAYYESNGWRVGKNPMKNWRAAVRTWNSKEELNGANRKDGGRNNQGGNATPYHEDGSKFKGLGTVVEV